jgi:hypothetical protein
MNVLCGPLCKVKYAASVKEIMPRRRIDTTRGEGVF